MKFENTKVYNFEGAIESMRMPMMSHKKSDSFYDEDGYFIIGDADMKLAQSLIKGGAEHAKYLRTIYVNTVITCPQYFAAELDTYKIGTVRNSSSLMHKGASRDFTKDDFTIDEDDGLSEDALSYALDNINYYRRKYVETKDFKYFRIMRQLMPMGYNYTFSFSTNYAQLRNMWLQRIDTPHRLKEWTEDFALWIKSLPYAEDLIFYKGEN